MIKLKYLSIGLLSTAFLSAGTAGIVHAATVANSKTNVGSSGITKSVMKTDRLLAMSQVLNTSTANIQSAHRGKTLSKLISSAGLTRKEYQTKLKAQLISDLEKQGYTSDQVTIARQHHTIARLRHEDKKEKTKNPS